MLVVGAGGIGCSLLSYLSAAGTGTLGIADSDKVDITNLHRQVLFNEDQTGESKAESAADNLKKMNSGTEYKIFNEHLGKLNSESIVSEFDIVADATDNFRSRYIINDICVKLGKPLIWGAVSRFELQVSVFNFENGPDLRTAFPENLTAGNVGNCGEQGVIGPAAGITAMLMASEIIKIITGAGKILSGELLYADLLTSEFRKIRIKSPELVNLNPSG